MAGQSGDGSAERVALDGPEAEWIRERASALGISADEYLEHVVASLQSVESDETGESFVGANSVGHLRSRINALDEEVQAKIEDVRSRVVQVKRETDAKAPRDHDHEDLRAELDALDDAQEALDGTVDDVAATLDAVEGRVDTGFDNYEEILRYLVDRTDAIEEDTTALATAIVALRQATETLRSREQERRAAEELKRAANRADVTTARCAACENAVTVSLLTAPECPFCSATFSDVTPKQGIFGSATLETGTPPALEPGADRDDSTLTDVDDVATASDESEDPMEILDTDGEPVDVPQAEEPKPPEEPSNE